MPDFTRLDMTAAYSSRRYDVRLNIFNLTNTMYYEQVIASDGGRAVPGSGLTAMLTLYAPPVSRPPPRPCWSAFPTFSTPRNW